VPKKIPQNSKALFRRRRYSLISTAPVWSLTNGQYKPTAAVTKESLWLFILWPFQKATKKKPQTFPP